MELKLQGQIQLFLIWDDVDLVLSKCNVQTEDFRSLSCDINVNWNFIQDVIFQIV